jgi:hypothetical protein
MNRLPLLLAIALAAVGCSPKGATKGAAKHAAGEPAWAFPHTPHVEADVPCLACHASIAKSQRIDPKARDVQLPKQISKTDPCSGCHDTEPTYKLPARTTPYRVRMPHAAHLTRVKGDCRTCHKELPESGDRERKYPPMATCTGCHNHQKDFAEARCTPCHVDLRGYVPESAFAHKGDWLRVHGQLAKPSAETCAQCHDQTYCAECHAAATTPARPSILFPEAVDREFIHRGDYVSRHMVDAGANPASCLRCHGPKFCDACHTLQGVSPSRATGGALNVPKTHQQPGWANDKSSGHFHGDAARRDIVACAGCHDQGAQALCVGCHTSAAKGGPGTNPHPRAFLRKHDADDRTKNGMCLACHAR